MLFVSRSAKHRIQILAGEMEIGRTTGGAMIQIPRAQEYFAQFRYRALDAAERDAALAAFGERGDMAFGAIPSIVQGVVAGQGAGEFVAFEPEHMISKYDTGETWDDPRSDIPYGALGAHSEEERQAIKDLVERTILESGELGHTVLVVEVAEDAKVRGPQAPWPNYDKVRGPQSPKIILAKVDEDGYDPAAVLAYEQTRDSPRKSLVEGLELRIAARLAEDVVPVAMENELEEELIGSHVLT